jgi:hypothetical protein
VIGDAPLSRRLFQKVRDRIAARREAFQLDDKAVATLVDEATRLVVGYLR